MYEIRRIGRKKNGDCMYGHFGQASVYTFTLNEQLYHAFPKRVTRWVGERIDPRLGIGVRVPPRVQNPDLPPREFERSFGTKHME